MPMKFFTELRRIANFFFVREISERVDADGSFLKAPESGKFEMACNKSEVSKDLFLTKDQLPLKVQKKICIQQQKQWEDTE